LILEKLYALQHKIRLQAAGIRYALLHENNPAVAASIAPPRRLALLITGLIGDSVMCTPVIRESRRLWPEAHITLIGMNHNCELLSGFPEIDEFHVVQVDPFTLRHRHAVHSFRHWLTSRSFDVAIVLLGDQYAVELARAQIPVRVGCSGHPLSRCLTHVFDNATPQTWGPGEKLNSLRVLGYPVRDVPPAMPVHEPAREAAAAALARLGIGPNDQFGVVHPFGRMESRRWPADSCNRLAARFYDRYHFPLLLDGNSEAPFPESPGHGLIDARGKISLRELPAVYEQAAFVISTDSGPFHIAGALGKPLVGLFRSIYMVHASRYPQARIVIGTDEACRGRCAWDRCRRVPCRQMSSISIDEVLQAVELAYGGQPQWR
jgi:ADP-heptose:LPS heptosyltransferase